MHCLRFTRTRGNHRRFHRSIALFALLAACGGDESGASSEVWRFAIEEAAGSVQDSYARRFEQLIEERTQGQVDVKVYPLGALGTSDDITEQLRMGSLQFVMASPGHLGKTIPELQALLLHFVFSDDDDVNQRALRDPQLLGTLSPLFEAKGMQLLSLLPEGWMVWTTQKAIESPADFEGVKIRTMTSPLLLAAYEAYGASPQAMPYGEVYSALQLNMIDAQVNPIFAIEEMSFYEVTSHLTRARPAPFLTTVVTNQEFVSALTPERRALIAQVVKELEPELYELQRTLNEERLAIIRERSPELVVAELSEEAREEFRERSLPVRNMFLEQAGDAGKEVLEELLGAVERAAE